MNNKEGKSRIWNYVLWGVLLAVFLIPQSRIFLQQQLMKLGFFKPKLETVQEPAPSESTTVETVTPAASFKDEAGNVYDVPQLKGKVLFINFWATWCPPCKAEMPSIQVLFDKFKDNDQVQFFLVEIENDIPGANKFLKQEDLTLPIVYPNSAIPQQWLSGAIPTTVILNKKGELVGREEGMRDYSAKTVEDFIQNLINQE
ncbi:thiol-disulfide isomerase/thioredoxin [Sphingobacterium alimentarium]|uniref:Thiol-disulfide isomerase/thioredoxin n=1 Tax=Sphingobacterium alimentarium TaxID=797292 RepID=A0A4R3VL83_9SPHI|nr:TlpA disulfide reductase family protein [Sphingobacterium alimentarium]TCV05358.1 thiol-disulfide isomerase/thioredoxin [Sphingobacterium alimentarium]